MMKTPADARLAVHERIAQILLGVLAEADSPSEEDTEIAQEIAEELVAGLGLIVTNVDHDVVHCTMTLLQHS